MTIAIRRRFAVLAAILAAIILTSASCEPGCEDPDWRRSMAPAAAAGSGQLCYHC